MRGLLSFETKEVFMTNAQYGIYCFTAIMGIVLSLIFYFLPAYIAREKRNWKAILALNFLLGWTVLGWIIALVWALTKDSESSGHSPSPLTKVGA